MMELASSSLSNMYNFFIDFTIGIRYILVTRIDVQCPKAQARVTTGELAALDVLSQARLVLHPTTHILFK